MDSKNVYLKEKYKQFELEDEIECLKEDNKELSDENKRLTNENSYLKSTKAFKSFKKYLKVRDRDTFNKLFSKKSSETKNLKDIKVAIIADQFTYDSYKYEFNAISLMPDTWKKQFEEEKPDLFFCESAWDGHDFEGVYGPWRNKILKLLIQEEENRGILFEILDYCRDNSIPTIFWSKEDPTHYSDGSVSFAETAKEFDYIFTSSNNCIKHYKKDFNHENVYTLMFAGQPKLFNPLNLSNETIDEIVFAGSYYESHPERAKLMEDIFDRLIENNQELLIFNRQYYKDWGNYPERYDKYVKPPIDYKETPIVYKKMKWGLNFNIVTGSETMFARRVFELALSNVNILTNYSLGVDKIFADNVFVFDKCDELPDFSKDYEEKRLNNLYNVLENHTYKNRWKEILDTIGFNYIEDEDYVDVIYKVKDSSAVEDVVANFNDINYPYKILKIFFENNENIEELNEKFPDVDGFYLDKNKLMGEVNGEFWILADEKIESDFVKNAILHYQYLNKRVSIKKGSDKFTLDIDDSIENKIINKINLDYLSRDDNDIDVYYI